MPKPPIRRLHWAIAIAIGLHALGAVWLFAGGGDNAARPAVQAGQGKRAATPALPSKVTIAVAPLTPTQAVAASKLTPAEAATRLPVQARGKLKPVPTVDTKVAPTRAGKRLAPPRIALATLPTLKGSAKPKPAVKIAAVAKAAVAEAPKVASKTPSKPVAKPTIAAAPRASAALPQTTRTDAPVKPAKPSFSWAILPPAEQDPALPPLRASVPRVASNAAPGAARSALLPGFSLRLSLPKRAASTSVPRSEAPVLDLPGGKFSTQLSFADIARATPTALPTLAAANSPSAPLLASMPPSAESQIAERAPVTIFLADDSFSAPAEPAPVAASNEAGARAEYLQTIALALQDAAAQRIPAGAATTNVRLSLRVDRRGRLVRMAPQGKTPDWAARAAAATAQAASPFPPMPDELKGEGMDLDFPVPVADKPAP